MPGIFDISIKTFYRVVILIASAFWIIVYAVSFQTSHLHRLVLEAQYKRQESLIILGDVRATFNAMQTMAQLYINTGDTQYKEYFFDILDICNGQGPLPDNYSSLYWDFVLGGSIIYDKTGAPGGLPARIKQYSFSLPEIKLLVTALEDINKMATITENAFSVAENNRTPNSHEAAFKTLYTQAYFRLDNQIADAITQFINAVDLRTQADVAKYSHEEAFYLYLMQLITFIALVISFYAYLYAGRRVAMPIKKLTEHAEQIMNGDYSARNTVTVKNEMGILGATLNRMCDAVETDVNEHKQMEMELIEHEHELALINKLNDQLQICQSSKDAYGIICKAAEELFPNLSGGLSILYPGDKHLVTISQWGKDQILKSMFSPKDCWAVQTDQLYLVNYPETVFVCEHFSHRPPGGYIGVPFMIQDELIGCLHLNAGPKQEIDANQQQLAATFSEVVKLSLSNIKLRETLKDQAIHDHLTGLYNRRFLTEFLEHDLRRSIREKHTLSVAMLDLDHFKDFNDKYGHAAGDLILQEVGSVLRKKIRGSDIACRYGGEEFVLILVNLNAHEAKKKMQEIARDINKMSISYQGKPLPAITVSIGIADTSNQTSVDGIIHAADEAMYAAKQHGRDRIEIDQHSS